jgi:hypothetical protein
VGVVAGDADVVAVQVVGAFLGVARVAVNPLET